MEPSSPFFIAQVASVPAARDPRYDGRPPPKFAVCTRLRESFRRDDDALGSWTVECLAPQEILVQG